MQYVCTFHMPLFFFISGYLSKYRIDFHANLLKYWKSLIIPYFLYNIIFYPYWLIRIKLENNGDYSAFNIVIKPIIGVLFGQIETPVSCIVSGVTWFLVALLFMRVVVDLCNKYKNSILIMVLASFIFTLIYISSEYYHTLNNLLMKGFLRCFPFYVLGHLFQRKQCYSGTSICYQAITALILYSVSISIFIFAKHCDIFWKHILLGYIISLTAIFAVLSTCKLLNNFTSKALINISTGTIMIMGLHWMFIGTTNYFLQKMLELKNEILYEWYTAILLSLAIVFIIYPFILVAKKYFPILLGK